MHGGDARHHLLDARIERAGLPIHAHQPRDLVCITQGRDRIIRQVQLVAGACLPHGQRPPAALDRDGARGARGILERRQHDFIGVRKAGLLPGQRAHADALFDGGAAFLDDAVLQRPRLLVRELEVQVREVHRVAHQVAEHLLQP